MKYKIQTWKLLIQGEYDSEEEAIKDLADRYMQCSKCDAPNDHLIEHLTNKQSRLLENIAKRVYFYAEMEIFGNVQWIHKYTLNIYPFKDNHWWEDTRGNFKFEEREFKYEIVD